MVSDQSPNRMGALYSPEQVRDMFPEGRRPELRSVIRKAKDLGCCCKLGRGIGFTAQQVNDFFAGITAVPKTSHRTELSSPIGRQEDTYKEVLKRLQEGRKNKPRKRILLDGT